MVSHQDKNCNGCKYYHQISTHLLGCHYIFMEGKRRPCDPGKDCTVKDTGKRRRKKKGD